MYEYLDGRLASRQPARLVLDVKGVGYDLAVPLGADFRTPRGDSETLRVWTHLVVREDAHALYGFPSRSMRELFRLLLSVRGVGPALALGVLSGLREDELFDAIRANDIRPLVRLKGVGRKTAEQILLDLRDKAARMQAGRTEDGVVVPRGAVPSRAFDDAVRALTSIGYSAKEAHKSVERAAQKVDPSDLELLVRTALQD